MDQIKVTDLPAFHSPLGGGFFKGLINVDGNLHALVVSPKASGEFKGEYGEYGQDIPGAKHYSDGLANTKAMAEAGSELAKKVLALEIGGETGWHIPARDALELLYRTCKPTTNENVCSFRDGDNPSSVPAGYPYTDESPAQATDTAFQDGGAEAFEDSWYWASTQSSANRAWFQHFGNGSQDWYGKNYEGRARAVRLIPVV